MELNGNQRDDGNTQSISSNPGDASASSSSDQLQLPPGFRFHPTDEELVVHYLTRKLASHSFKPLPIVTEVDLYKFDPWELPQQASFGDKEWYFFSPRDRKYPNGVRPNRAAASGYWKATGTDKMIHSSADGRKIGVKKALVFYKGRAPKGIKSNWIMHEYRLVDPNNKALFARKRGSLRLDDWVLCRIYKKKAKSFSRAAKNEANRKSGKGNSLEEEVLASLPQIGMEEHQGTHQGNASNYSTSSINNHFVQPLAAAHENSASQILNLSLQMMRSSRHQQQQHQEQQQQQQHHVFNSSGSRGWQFGNMLLEEHPQSDLSMVSPCNEAQPQSTARGLLDKLDKQRSLHDLEQNFHQQQTYHGYPHRQLIAEDFINNAFALELHGSLPSSSQL